MRPRGSSRIRPVDGLALVLASLLAVPATTARADDPAPMPARIVVQPSCELEVEEIVRLLRIELTGDGVSDVVIAPAAGEAVATEEDESAAAIVRLEATPCEPGADELTVTIDDLVTHKQVRRVLSASGLPESTRARAITLGVAELLRASWAELSLSDGGSSPMEAWLRSRLSVELTARSEREDEEPIDALAIPEPAAPAESVTKPTSGPPTVMGSVSFAATLMPSGGSALIGGALDGSLRLAVDAFALRVELTAEVGRAEARLGGVDLGMATLALIPELRSELGRAMFALGPRIAAGIGWASGQPDPGIEASSGAELVISAGADVRVLWRLTETFWGTLGLSGGYMIRGLETIVDAAPDGGLVGAYVALHIGIALSDGGT